MSKSIDEIIRAAIERGEFDNLPKTGKPPEHTACRFLKLAQGI
jgi:hypothetical protein